MTDRIVITGMGAISPLGLTVDETWQNILNGVSGVAPITLFDASDFQVRIACEVKGFDPEEFMPQREARRRDRFEQFTSAAASQAIRQAGLEADTTKSGRVGVIIASAIGGVRAFQDAVLTMDKEGPRRVSPFVIPMLMANGGAGLVAIDHGFMGPAFSVSSACASGADGLGVAWHLLRSGAIDVAVTGGSEATVTQIGIAAFDRLGAMSRKNELYTQTPQPFDRERDGLVMGEGAAILVLEKEEHARNAARRSSENWPDTRRPPMPFISLLPPRMVSGALRRSARRSRQLRSM